MSTETSVGRDANRDSRSMKMAGARPGTFEWLRYPDAEAYVAKRVDEFVAAMPVARDLAEALHAHTSSRLVDWLDHLE